MTNVTNLPVAQPDPSEIMEAVLLAGDLSKLSADEKTQYFMQTCKSLGLNPFTKPFDYIRLSGREVLYATKGCADQLRSNRRISLQITDRKIAGDLLVVTVRATTPDGRTDEDMAAVSIKGLAGEALSNAMMKVTTKAKRRVTLSICGLGMLDESEVQSVLAAERETEQPARVAAPPPRPPEPPPPPATQKPPVPTFSVAVPFGGEPAVYPRTRGGAKEAFAEIVAMVNEGHPEVVQLNNEILDEIAARVPALADEVANLRAAAAEALAAADAAELADEALSSLSAHTTDDEDFPGDLPPRGDAGS